jgi:hypothetical protein
MKKKSAFWFLDELFLCTVLKSLDVEVFSSHLPLSGAESFAKRFSFLRAFCSGAWCFDFPTQSIAAGLGSAVVFNSFRSHLIFLLQHSSGPLPVLLAARIFMFPTGAVQHELFQSSSKCALGFSRLDLSPFH